MKDVWLMRNGNRHGPYYLDELRQWKLDGRLRQGDMYWHAGLDGWRSVEALFATTTTRTAEIVQATTKSHNATLLIDDSIRRIADYERLSAIFWMILGIIQILSIVGVIAGIWNLISASERFKIVPRIRERDPSVPQLYEGIAGIVIIGLVNLFIGGGIGVLFATFDFYIRDQVLSRRHLFQTHQ